SGAARVLAEAFQISPERVRSEIEPQLARGGGSRDQAMQLTSRAKRVIELSWEEAQSLGHDYIGTEHLLLGLLAEGDGLAAQVLAKLGADLETARAAIRAMQTP